MNGQPYNNSGSNSANGTPTPSSTSYPASLSSHSSRDTSPSRLPPNLNHLSPDKTNYFVSNNYTQPYKTQIDPNVNSNSVNSIANTHNIGESAPVNRAFSPHVSYPNQLNSSIRSSQPQSMNIITTTPQLPNYPQNQSKLLVSSSQPLTTQQAILSNSGQKSVTSLFSKADTNNSPQRSIDSYSNSPGQNIPLTSNLFPTPSMQNFRPENVGRMDHYAAQKLSQGFTQLPQKPPLATSHVPPELVNSSQQHNISQNFIPPNDSLLKPTSQPTYNYTFPPTNQVGSYGVGITAKPSGPSISSPVNRVSQEEPISSGPPRTNVLGIIPYSTEPANIISQSSLGTRTVPSQPPNALQPPRQPSVQYGSYPYGDQTHLQNRTMAVSRPSPPSPNIQPQYVQPTASLRNQQYSNQYGHRPPDNFSQPQLNHLYSSPQYPQDNLSGPTQYSGGYYSGLSEDVMNQMSNLSVTQSGYNRLWGKDTYDLLKCRDILPSGRVEPPAIRLQQELYEANNCSSEIFRCTLTKIPETKSLLDKSRLPLGVLIHPFKDLNQLSVIQCSVIVRCRACRTYINPFVYFIDTKHWKCNLCFRVNDLPGEFEYDPLTKTYGDPSRRPEIKSATIEFIAPSEYMVRPPQPAAYVFVIDISRLGAEAGYLKIFCETLLSQLDALPGDSRTAVAFITFDSSVHFYSLADIQSQPHQMVVVDIDDMFVPCPDNLLVNLSECLSLVRDLLKELPNKYSESFETGSALGPALQAAYKLLAATGGRITVFQSCLPNCGSGSLPAREDPSQRTADNVTQAMLNPVTDFYKKLALDCSGQQIAVDLFILNSQFVDLASLCGVSRFSGGCIYHFPLFSIKNSQHIDALQRTLQRYLCRKIGFESVMRLRCTRGLSIHTFHGNFFVRSTDLLSLPNVNPDAGFGMQVSIDENLNDIQNVCFQAALLYTSSKGERRIRVHTLCLPIASNLSDVLHSADQQCIIGLLAKMAVDRCHQSSLSDAREAFVNVVSDMLSAYRLTQSSNPSSSLLAPESLRLLPLYILALLKHVAFRIGQSTRLDDRVYAMCQMKTLPLQQLMQSIYPDLYPVHNILDYPELSLGDETVVQPPRLHLSAERIDSQGVYLLDDGETLMIYVGHNITPALASALFNVPSFASINPNICELPLVDSAESERLRSFVGYLQNEKPVSPTVCIIRDDTPQRQKFLEKLVEDKTEAGHSYYEFLQRVKLLVK